MLGRDTRLDGPLHVSTMDLFFCNFQAAFASFAVRYPAVDLIVDTSLDRVSLTRREADVALRLTNQPPEYLVGRRVGRVQFAVYAAESLIARIGEGAPLQAYPWIGFSDSAMAAWLDRWLEAHAPGAKYLMRVDDNARAREHMLVAGTGVFLNACFEGDALPGVRRISPLIEEHAHDVWLLTLRELRSTTRVRAFMDHMSGVFAEAAPRLAGEG